MLNGRKIWFLVFGLFSLIFLLTIIFFEPLFLRKKYIAKHAGFNISTSAQIIDYRFGVSSWGVDPFYAKLSKR